MRIAVMGAGAVGCYYGGALARAGREVRLIGRARHVDAVNRHGLLLETDAGGERVRLSATTGADGVRGAGLVLCCVKSADTARAAADMEEHLDADAIVVSLQNGVGNPGALRASLAREVLPAAVYVAARMAGDGHVRHHGGGKLVLGDTPRAGQVAEIFAGAGIPVEISGNIEGELWTKLIVNCAYNALSALSGLPYARLTREAGVARALRDVAGECLAVAEKAGVAPAGDVWASIERIPFAMPGQLSSTAQDLQRGHPTEIDHLNGFIARRGEELGVPTPVNRLLHTLVKILETRSATH
ncbi:MAG: ketopantoate reductase family protein [Candidatus Accumulibacter sp.]|jgi:2-dehydropantoate 2-reductase|nr:ketopantoate reductase family protein [Accumulibacter sp.]